MNGVFDNISSKKYNDAIPDYDVNDGIDNVKCDNKNCIYRDVELGRCLFETCIQNQFPLSIPFHESFTCKCKLCYGDIKIHFKDMVHPFNICRICDNCLTKLKNLINIMDNIKVVAYELTPDSDVKSSCGYTVEQLESAIREIYPEGCSAEQFPKVAIELEKSIGINALFTISAAIRENGWDGPVDINTTGEKYGDWNVFWILGKPNSPNGRFKYYISLTDAFEEFGELIMGNTYYKDGLTTPEKIGERYCPPGSTISDVSWAEEICKIANDITSKIPTKG